MQKVKYTPVECYYCGNMIEEYVEHVQKEIPIFKSPVKMVYKDLHVNCAVEVAEMYHVEAKRDEEEFYFDKSYKKLQEILNIGSSKHLATRLSGLRINKYKPRNEGVIMRNIGYPYDVIYATILFKEEDIRRGVSRNTFKDINHKVNYAMIIVSNHIDDVYARIKANKEQASRLEAVDTNVQESKEKFRIKHTDDKMDKVRESIRNMMWIENEPIDDYDKLFND